MRAFLNWLRSKFGKKSAGAESQNQAMNPDNKRIIEAAARRAVVSYWNKISRA